MKHKMIVCSVLLLIVILSGCAAQEPLIDAPALAEAETETLIVTEEVTEEVVVEEMGEEPMREPPEAVYLKFSEYEALLQAMDQTKTELRTYIKENNLLVSRMDSREDVLRFQEIFESKRLPVVPDAEITIIDYTWESDDLSVCYETAEGDTFQVRTADFLDKQIKELITTSKEQKVMFRSGDALIYGNPDLRTSERKFYVLVDDQYFWVRGLNTEPNKLLEIVKTFSYE